LQLLLGLHAFSHGAQPQAMRQRHGGFDQQPFAIAGRHLRHEAVIDLQLVHRAARQLRHGRRTGAEIIEPCTGRIGIT
jgi:hypothetical protein